MRIKPRLEMGFIAWMWRFGRSCTRSHFRKAVEVFSRLNREGLAVHRELAALGGNEFEFSQRGLLYLFLTDKTRDHAFKEAEHLKELGIQAQPLSREEVRGLEPSCAPEVRGRAVLRGGLLLPSGRVRPLAGRQGQGGRGPDRNRGGGLRVRDG